jgi:hypothetical protein
VEASEGQACGVSEWPANLAKSIGDAARWLTLKQGDANDRAAWAREANKFRPRVQAWWLQRMLQAHPPRIPPEDRRFTPSARQDEPRAVPVAPCLPTAQPFLRYALEVLDAELLHELLCWWSAAVDPDLRHVVHVDGKTESKSFREASEENAAAIREAARLAAELEKVRPHFERGDDLQEIAEWHDEQADSSSLRVNQITRERVRELDEKLRSAGWTRRDVARLIIASAASTEDWDHPPMPSPLRPDLRDPRKLEAWIVGRVLRDADWNPRR